MKPIHLTISGWGSYPNKVDVDFRRFYEDHLFLITGPTGAGKTTIFDGISFALYGDVSGNTREKSSVRSDFSAPDTDTYVELIFSHKNTEYRIHRSPRYTRPKKRGEGYTTTNEIAQLYIGDEEPLVNVMEVNRKIEDIMGINYDQFKKIVMIAQGEFLELLVSSSKERATILRSLFRTDKYEKLQYDLKDKANALYREIDHVKNRMDEAVNLIDKDTNETLNELLNGERYQYEQIIEVLKKNIASDKKRFANLQKEIGLIEDLIIKQVVAITEGEQNNETIHNLEKATIQYETLELKRDIIKIQEEKLKKANYANKVKSEERFYQEQLQRTQTLENRINVLFDKKEELKPILAKALAKKIEAEEQEDRIVHYREKAASLEGYLPLLQEYVNYHKNLLEMKNDLLLIQEQEVQVSNRLKEQRLIRHHSELEYESYDNVEEDIGNNNLLIEQSKSITHSFEQGESLVREINTESNGLRVLHAKYKDTLAQMDIARQSYQNKEEIYKNAIVGIVAKLVKEDEPCPVCGSTDHPKIAKISHEVPDEQELDKLREYAEEKRLEHDKVYQECAIKKAYLEQMEEQLVQLVVSVTKEELRAIEFNSTEVGESKIDKCSRVLLQGKGAHISWCEELYNTRDELSKKKIRRDKLKNELQNIGKVITELEDNLKVQTLMFNDTKNMIENIQTNMERVQNRIPKEMIEEAKQQGNRILDQVKNELEEIQGSIATIRAQQVAAREQYDRIKEEVLANDTLCNNETTQLQSHKIELGLKKEEYRKALLENYFNNEEEYKAAIIDDVTLTSLDNEVNEFYNSLQSLEKTKESLKEQVKDGIYVDIMELKSKWNELKKTKEDLLHMKEHIGVRIRSHQKVVTSMSINLKDKQQKELEYGVVKDLDNITRGYNKERLVFEQYVLTSYFEDVIRAANIRLATMTNGRYELYKISKVVDARTTDSLNLEVLDHYTGKKRSVKTLSGGESFKAALSLALGLSDIVQNNAGGIQIETLFIDEGFGALDTESLDHALNTLTSLSAGNRLIGIISHVNELKERIDHQIIVEKGKKGSNLRIV